MLAGSTQRQTYRPLPVQPRCAGPHCRALARWDPAQALPWTLLQTLLQTPPHTLMRRRRGAAWGAPRRCGLWQGYRRCCCASPITARRARAHSPPFSPQQHDVTATCARCLARPMKTWVWGLKHTAAQLSKYARVPSSPWPRTCVSRRWHARGRCGMRQPWRPR